MINKYSLLYYQICKGTQGGEILTDFLKNVIHTDKDINRINGVGISIEAHDDIINTNGSLIIVDIDNDKCKAKWIVLSNEDIEESICERKSNDTMYPYKEIGSIELNGIEIKREDYTKLTNFIKQFNFKEKVYISRNGESLHYSKI